MRFFTLLIGMILLPVIARAQVSVNPAALQQLAGIAAPAAVASARVVDAVAPVKRPAVYRATGHWIKVVRRVGFVVPKPNPEPPSNPLPPKPVPVVARVPLKPLGPATLVFADGSAQLPLSAPSVLKPFCKANGVLTIDARAAGDPSDPSVAMRLSLARAMAVRDALLSCGVAAQNIIPRAVGAVPGTNDDVTELAPAK